MATHISQIILNKIEKEKITPKAKWYFVIEHAVLWVPGVLVTSLGAVAVAGIAYAVAHSGLEYSEFIYKSKMDFLVASAPLLWILSFSIFSSLIVRALRSTHAGYKLSVKKILFGSIGISIIVGVCGYLVDETFKTNSVIRYPVHMREEQVWTSPQEGRIAGRIEKKSETDLLIRDKNNMLWNIDMSGFGSTTFPFVEEGKSIRVIGTSTNEIHETEDVNEENKEHTFIACAVFPWEIGEPFRKPLPMQNQSKHELKPRNQNKNPDCKLLLDSIKMHVRGGMKENK